MKPILFFSPHCPDTTPFVATLQQLGIDYEEANISDSMANLKRFLILRDSSPAFTARKLQGYIGIPALLLGDGEVIFDVTALRMLK